MLKSSLKGPWVAQGRMVYLRAPSVPRDLVDLASGLPALSRAGVSLYPLRFRDMR